MQCAARRGQSSAPGKLSFDRYVCSSHRNPVDRLHAEADVDHVDVLVAGRLDLASACGLGLGFVVIGTRE